jgi:uncharacterized protein (TIGR02611 family)
MTGGCSVIAETWWTAVARGDEAVLSPPCVIMTGAYPTTHDHQPIDMFDVAYRLARRIAITVVGFTVLAIGIAMMVLPGPAFIVIPIGLGILGLEFAWARRWLKTVKEKAEAVARSVTKSGGSDSSTKPDRPDATPKS